MMKRYLVCFVAAAAMAGTASAQDNDLRSYCGDMAKARGELSESPWAIQCARTLQVQRNYAQRADSQRQIELRLQQNQWVTLAMRSRTRAKEAPTDAEKKIAEANLSDLLAACPGYFRVTECVEWREELSR
jgi:hypothetical protein